MKRPCGKGLHDLADPDNLGRQASSGDPFCKPCKAAYQAARRGTVPVPEPSGHATVVTFKADRAADFLARFETWADGAAVVQDLGVTFETGVHRYQVDAAQWAAYSKAVTKR